MTHHIDSSADLQVWLGGPDRMLAVPAIADAQRRWAPRHPSRLDLAAAVIGWPVPWRPVERGGVDHGWWAGRYPAGVRPVDVNTEFQQVTDLFEVDTIVIVPGGGAPPSGDEHDYPVALIYAEASR